MTASGRTRVESVINLWQSCVRDCVTEVTRGRRRPVTGLSHEERRVGTGAVTLRQARQNHWFFLILAVVLAVGACKSGKSSTDGDAESAPHRRASATLTIKGSDTMVILAQKWAQAFMEKNPGKELQVSGGGTGTGIAALINGTADLANASRPMKEREEKQLAERRGVDPQRFRVALDALAVYVPTSNEIESLTIPQLKKIFRGQVNTWKELGGEDRPIVLYSRENNSGTYAYFKEHVLENEDFAAAAQTLPGTAAVINAVSKDPGGIGYGGIAYGEGVRTVKVATADDEPVEPSMENATNGKYPLSRFLNVYSAGEPSGLAKDYLDFILSPAGQQVVEGVGYYPLPKEAESDSK